MNISLKCNCFPVKKFVLLSPPKGIWSVIIKHLIVGLRMLKNTLFPYWPLTNQSNKNHSRSSCRLVKKRAAWEGHAKRTL